MRLLFIVLLSLCSAPLYAAHCSLQGGGVQTYNFNLNFDSQQNYIGYKTGWQQQKASGSYKIGGACNTTDNTYFTATTGETLTYNFTDGNGEWYDIGGNDYLQIASQIMVYNARNGGGFRNVPFTDVQNDCSSALGCGSFATTGSSVKINLRVKRKFVGASWVNHIPIFYLYANQGGRGQGTGSPFVIGYLTAKITVPQSCEINAGQIVSFNFGNIPARQFSEAGPGGRPAGIAPQSKTLAIQCKNIAAQALLSLRIEADTAAGNMLVSDNPDAGFIIADASGKPLTPNTLNSRIQFALDDNASASVGIRAWPVSVTGRKPREGEFTTRGYLRVDFD
ncbi:fimbrial protein [Pantoea sp. 1.19]|uniref:fimbrial protein n=1 Tax=Pantoea sp. 1.19 TaxID=1925589 RepID=UPI000948CDBA|nr:fimbrial protein [Pantoea sp. 1.19]